MVIDNKMISSEIAQLKGRSFVDYAGMFGRLARQAPNDELRKVYETLHDVCMLSYYDDGDPYGPFFLPMGAERELEMSIEQYDVLAAVVDQIEDVKVKARIADLLWVCGKKTKGKADFKYAQMAVAAFSAIEIDEKTWLLDGVEHDWARALRLTAGLGKGGSEAYEKMRTILNDAFKKASESGDVNNLLRWAIPSMLAGKGLPEVIPANRIAGALEKLSEECESAGDGEYSVQVHARAASEWYHRAGDDRAWERMVQREAESFCREAETEKAKEAPQWFRVAHFYQAALNDWHSLSASSRKQLGAEDKMKEVKRLFEDACQFGCAQMNSLRGPTVDITQPVKVAEGAVGGKSAEDALSIFVRLYAMKESDAERLADAFLKSSVVSALFGKSIVAGGRLVSSAPPSNLQPDSEEYKARLWVEKVQRAGYLLQVACHACLMPAYHVLRDEHQLDVSAFLSLVNAAPLVPASHKRTYAEALHVGYQGMFAAACYMLAPEIENVVRHVLKTRGAVTTVLDTQSKLYQEIGLSKLVEKCEAELTAAFSSDFVFELKAIFTDHAGPNVRNEVAHGLKTDATFNSTIDFYVWWFALTLVFMRPVSRSTINATKVGS